MNLGGVWRREKEKGGRGKGNIKRMKDSFMGWVGFGNAVVVLTVGLNGRV